MLVIGNRVYRKDKHSFINLTKYCLMAILLMDCLLDLLKYILYYKTVNFKDSLNKVQQMVMVP